jgi:hypothetical protein
MPALEIEPKSLRSKTFWVHKKVLDASIPNELAKITIVNMTEITCRDCFGFGHSAKKCPTARKFDIARHTNNLLKTLISRYRAKLSNNLVNVDKNSQVWLFKTSIVKDIEPIKQKLKDGDQMFVDNFVKGLDE